MIEDMHIADLPHTGRYDPGPQLDAGSLAERFRRVRARSIALAAPLSPEDAMLQSMADASPSKWHLAHSTWFFERFVLAASPGYRRVNADWDVLFNSYYHAAGPMHSRPHRGLLSRPTLAEVLAYREQVERRMIAALERDEFDREMRTRILLGTHHEQQHQELLLTDIKHAFWCNPLRPAYRDDLVPHPGRATPLRWVEFDERIVEIGATAAGDDASFAFDNEVPRHRVLVPAYAIAHRPVSNGDYRAFIDDGGYRNPVLWMSEGWARIAAEGCDRPLYWDEDLSRTFTLAGMREIDPHAPVCHLSYFEADAFARWAGARLPTEFEWERAAAGLPLAGNFAENDALHPQPSTAEHAGLQQFFGDVWEWTASAYTPYPGFRAFAGALGEYNGKFMCGQWILRGGSCATPRDHIRASYRNFFHPPDRWQFSGLRLAKDPA